MSIDARAAMLSASLALVVGFGGTCNPEGGGAPAPGPSEHCGEPSYASEHAMLCFGGCKDRANITELGCAPCIGNADDPLCGGECATEDCTGSSSSTSDGSSDSSSSSSTSDSSSDASSSSGDTDVDDREVVEIATGNSHTCVRLGDGNVRCWGHLYAIGLELGEGVGDDEMPSAVDDVDIGGIAVDISAGTQTCVVLESGGVRCWGENDDGQLGHGLGPFALIGDNESPTSVPEIWFNPGAADPLNDPPPADAPHAVAVSAAERGTCALLDDERVWCWGAGSVIVDGGGETIGDDEHASVATPHVFEVGIAAVSRGDNTACVLRTNGGVRCWGLSFYGALGYPGISMINAGFTEAAAQDVDIGAMVVELKSSTVATCALTDVPDVRCWGPGGNGSLGHGNMNHVGDNDTPASAGGAAIGGPARAMCIAPTHGCAVLDDGTVRCYGNNNLGHLGLGHTDTIGDDELPSSEPAIDFGREAVAISCGGAHTCALLEDGAVRCWGANGAGQLGLGHTDNVMDADDPLVPDVEVQ